MNGRPHHQNPTKTRYRLYFMIRPFEDRDAEGVTHVENDAILNSSAHPRVKPITPSETRNVFNSGQGKFPWFVAEEEGDIVGFARCGPWRDGEAFAYAAEISVFVLNQYQRRGIGKKLYEALFDAMVDVGITDVIATLTLPNDAAVRLHESFFMQNCGILPRVALKFDKLWNVGVWLVGIGGGEKDQNEPPILR